MRFVQRSTLLVAAAASLAALAPSCARLDTHTVAKSPLAAPAPVRNAVALEMYWIRFPLGDESLTDSMWNEVDEHVLAVDVRRRLHANGFRAGVLGSQLPSGLAALMDAADDPSAEPPPPADSFAAHEVDVTREPQVLRSVRQVPPDGHAEIIAAGAHERLPRLVALVVDDETNISGKSFQKAAGVLSVRPVPAGDDVRLEMTPQVQHGEPQNRFVPVGPGAGPGAIRMEIRSEVESFDRLAIRPTLGPGQLLIIGCRNDVQGSLGYEFFTERRPGEPQVQKLLIIRVVDRPRQDLFAENEIPDARNL